MKYPAFPRPTRHRASQNGQLLPKLPKQDATWFLCLIPGIFVYFLSSCFFSSVNLWTGAPLVTQYLNMILPLFVLKPFLTHHTKSKTLSFRLFHVFQLSLYSQPIPHLTTRIDTPLLFPSTHPRETLPLMVCIGNSTTPTSSTSASQHVLPGT